MRKYVCVHVYTYEQERSFIMRSRHEREIEEWLLRKEKEERWIKSVCVCDVFQRERERVGTCVPTAQL